MHWIVEYLNALRSRICKISICYTYCWKLTFIIYSMRYGLIRWIRAEQKSKNMIYTSHRFEFLKKVVERINPFQNTLASIWKRKNAKMRENLSLAWNCLIIIHRWLYEHDFCISFVRKAILCFVFSMNETKWNKRMQRTGSLIDYLLKIQMYSPIFYGSQITRTLPMNKW